MKAPPPPPALIESVLQRLGLSLPVSIDHGALSGLYRAWSRTVPFTNLDKLAALRAGRPLPSLQPADILARFLENGTCGTCFSHAVGFHALLAALGFDVRTYAGRTTGDDDVVGEHATNVVVLDGGQWLVDTAMPHGVPLQLFRDRPSYVEGVMTPTRAEPFGDLWSLDCVIIHSGDRRRMVLEEPLRDVDHAADRWLRTLDETESPFNKLPVARLELDGACMTLAGRKLFTVNFQGKGGTEPAGPETLARFGIDPAGYESLWRRPADAAAS